MIRRRHPHCSTQNFSSPNVLPSRNPRRCSKKPIHVSNMEQFALSSAHSGAIQHIHTIQFAPSTIGLLREVRYAVTAVVIGWVAVTGVRAFFDRGRRS
ncbi:hypothetical protein CTRI78_v002791 [Colletotrichum trifolii]|uniref:Uncharacterized protein n=1 Tax=Colletotrichum trifolii TaxID=5466 RepID=A0A4R8RL32_COLTR|nr:hypothetical protein CTRI78_v002791 [Colletotrichum trifolii]